MRLYRPTCYAILTVLLCAFCPLFNLKAQCTSGDALEVFELGQEEFHFHNGGTLGSNRDFSGGGVVNAGAFNLNPIWFSGLWIGGKDASGNARVSASTFQFPFGDNCFWPGPLEVDAVDFADPESCSDWNQFFAMKAEDINAFRQDFADNGEINNSIAESIKGWPAAANPFFFDQLGFDLPLGKLAPFVDVNSDGIYNPNDGDYPDINDADQALWWLMNSNGNVNTCNSSENLLAEYHMMVYSYDSFSGSIYYDIDIMSKSLETVDSAYLAYFIDVPRLCYDKFIGSNPEEDYAFLYSDFSEPPACNLSIADFDKGTIIGLKQLQGAFSPRVFDIDGDLVYPSLGVEADTFIEQRMSSVKHYYRFSSTTVPFEIDPYNSVQYYNILQGKWRNGQDQIINGEVNPFAFPGNPANPQEGDFAMCNEEQRIEDLRMVVSSGPFRMEPASRHSFSYVMTRVPLLDTLACADTDGLTDKFKDLQRRFAEGTTSVHNSEITPNQVEVFPNPARSNATFVLERKEEVIQEINIYDLLGKKKIEMNGGYQAQQEVNLHKLLPGTYYYVIQTGQGKLYSGKFIKQ